MMNLLVLIRIPPIIPFAFSRISIILFSKNPSSLNMASTFRLRTYLYFHISYEYKRSSFYRSFNGIFFCGNHQNLKQRNYWMSKLLYFTFIISWSLFSQKRCTYVQWRWICHYSLLIWEILVFNSSAHPYYPYCPFNIYAKIFSGLFVVSHT